MNGGAVPTEEFGPYLVYEELGVGGMAQVHRAETTGIEGFRREVALKRILPHLAHDEEFVRSFVREARLAGHLRHNNVAQTYELGKVDDIYFIAMELVIGPDLRQVLRKCVSATGPMPVPITLNILGQICEALDYAHNLSDNTGQPLGIIHRDVSPSNIIVSTSGVVKLIDFGIAKASAAGMQTMSGTIKGKFGYMAPEYVAGTLDTRADLFAVGVIAHELLTSRPLFSGRDDIETLHKLRAMEVEPPSRRNTMVPREIDDIVMTALARDPDRRWHQASALRTVLSTVTRRLNLMATNQQVTEWVTWAFQQQPSPSASGSITDVEVYAYGDEDEPSISFDRGTSVLEDIRDPARGPHDVSTLVDGTRAPTPMPMQAVGTPGSMTAQRSIPPGNIDAPAYLDPGGAYGADGDRRRAASGRHHAMVPGTTRASDPAIMYPQPTLGASGILPSAASGAMASNPGIVPPGMSASAGVASNPGIVPPPGLGPLPGAKRTEYGVGPARSTPPRAMMASPSSPSGALRLPDLPPGATSGNATGSVAAIGGATGTAPPTSGAIAVQSAPGAAPVAPKSGRRIGFILLVLIAAIAAAAAVYFALPALT